MEDVLELYGEDYDPECPVVCFDKTSKQLIEDTRTPIAPRAGRLKRYDYGYKRNGTRNVSCDGMPLGSSSNRASQSLFDLPNNSTSTHESAPQTTAQMAMTMISMRLWRLE